MSNTEQEEEHNKVDVDCMTHQQQDQQNHQLVQENSQTEAIFPIEKTHVELSSPPPQPTSHQTTPVGIQRARSTTRKSILHRRKLALKLEPEVLFGQASNNNNNNSHSHHSSSHNSSHSSHRSSSKQPSTEQQEEQEIPWWVLEYKCPPPGHLGAHSVPVSSSKTESAKPKEKKSRRSLFGAFLEIHHEEEEEKQAAPLGMKRKSDQDLETMKESKRLNLVLLQQKEIQLSKVVTDVVGIPSVALTQPLSKIQLSPSTNTKDCDYGMINTITTQQHEQPQQKQSLSSTRSNQAIILSKTA